MVVGQFGNLFMSTLLLRPDASLKIGTGHVMRCLALAQGWQAQGGKTLIVMAKSTSNLDARLVTEGMQVLYLTEVLPGSLDDVRETAIIAQQHNAAWIIIDGYHFDAWYQKYLKEAGYPLLFVDDNGHARHYYADLILNQNIHANASMYGNRDPDTKLLLGPSYAVLRREFWSWRKWKRKIPRKARNILVTMGGSDPDNVTLKVIRALQQIEFDDLQFIIVVGGSNPHYHH